MQMPPSGLSPGPSTEVPTSQPVTPGCWDSDRSQLYSLSSQMPGDSERGQCLPPTAAARGSRDQAGPWPPTAARSSRPPRAEGALSRQPGPEPQQSWPQSWGASLRQRVLPPGQPGMASVPWRV